MARELAAALALFTLCCALVVVDAQGFNPLGGAPVVGMKDLKKKAKLNALVLKHAQAADELAKWNRTPVYYTALGVAADGSSWLRAPGARLYKDESFVGDMSWPLGMEEDYSTLPPTVNDTRAVKRFLKTINITCDSRPLNYSLAVFQTPIKNQYKRVTSAAFAVAAAMEAAYFRTKNIRVDLSEEYINWISQSTALDAKPKGSFESVCSCWGGGNAHSTVSKLTTFSTPEEKESPYRDRHEVDFVIRRIIGTGMLPARNASITQENIDNLEYNPLYIPRKATDRAHYGIQSAVYLYEEDVRSTCKLERIIASDKEVIVDVKMDAKWHEMWRGNGSQLATHVLSYNHTADGGYLTLLLVGYNSKKGTFIAKTAFGGSKFTEVSYHLIARGARRGAVITSVIDPQSQASTERKVLQRFLGRWYTDFDGARGESVIRRVAPRKNLGTFFSSPATYSRPSRRLKGTFSDRGRGLLLVLNKTKTKVYLHKGNRRGRLISGAALGDAVSGAILSGRPLMYQPLARSDSARIKRVEGKWQLTVDGEKFGELAIGRPYHKTYHGGARRIVRTKFQDAKFIGRYATGILLSKGVYGDDYHAVKVRVRMTEGSRPYHPTLWLFIHRNEHGILSGYTRSKQGDIVPVIGMKIIDDGIVHLYEGNSTQTRALAGLFPVYVPDSTPSAVAAPVSTPDSTPSRTASPTSTPNATETKSKVVTPRLVSRRDSPFADDQLFAQLSRDAASEAERVTQQRAAKANMKRNRRQAVLTQMSDRARRVSDN